MNDNEPQETAPRHPRNPDPAPGVSMMITRRQRADLKALGFSETEIRAMSPAEAHANLGLTT